MDAAESLGAINRMHGTARREVSPHRPIAPGTYDSPLPPSENVVSGAFFMRGGRGELLLRKELGNRCCGPIRSCLTAEREAYGGNW